MIKGSRKIIEFAAKFWHASPNCHLNEMGYQRKLRSCRDDGQVSPKPDACASKKVFVANEIDDSYQSNSVNGDGR